MICRTCRNLASEYCASSEPVSAAFGAGAQLGLEVADVGIGRRLRFERDVAAGVVVDLRQRGVDARDALADRLAPHCQLGVEVGHLADGVLVEQFLEARLEARQVVGLQLVEHVAVFEDRFDAGIDLGGVELELLLVGDHRLDDPVAQQVELACFGIHPRLQPDAGLLLAVFARFNAELMLAECLAAHRVEALEVRRLRRHLRIKQQRLRLLAQRAGVALPLLDSRALVALFLELRFQRLQRGDDFAQPLAELPEQIRR
jgi:hypothetical protein